MNRSPSDDLSARAKALLIVNRPPPPPAWNRARIKAMLWGTGVYVLLYVFIALSHAELSALLFLVMPLVSAMIVAGLVSHHEHVMKTCWLSVGVNLLASFLFLQEAALCVAMAAPIFAAMCLVGALLVRVSRGFSSPKPAPGRRILSILIALALLGYSAHDARVMATGAPVRTVTTTAAIPLWLRLWIPRPEAYDFAGAGLGARRAVDFGPPRPGDDGDTARGKVVYAVEEWDEQRACAFRCVENETVLGKWIELLDTRVELQPVAGEDAHPTGRTRVIIVTHYRSRLGPPLYFVPAMNAALRGVHSVLLEEMAEPSADARPTSTPDSSVRAAPSPGAEAPPSPHGGEGTASDARHPAGGDARPTSGK